MFNNKYGNFIYHKRRALSQEGCGYAIKFLEKRLVGKNGTYPVDRRDDPVKKCVELFVKRNQYTLFEDVLQSCIRDYRQKYPKIDLLNRWDIFEVFKLQRYKPGEGYFNEHCENSGVGNMGRVLAWMIYLNDVTDGGYTKFPNQNRKFQPRRGDILMWPAYFTHTHYGIVSKTQTKYIVTGWCTYNDV